MACAAGAEEALLCVPNTFKGTGPELSCAFLILFWKPVGQEVVQLLI